MSQLNVVKNSVSSDQIYYDVTVTNLQSTTTIPPIFYYNEARTIPFINNPQDYYLSILRFTIDTGTLPVFIPTIQPNQGDLDLTIYSVTLSYGGDDYQTFVSWVPQNVNATVPPNPSQTNNQQQDNSTGYYECYSYSYFCSLIYKAFVQSFALLLVDYPQFTPGTALTGTFPPVLNWDTTSGQGVLYADYNGYNFDPLIPGNDPIKIYMNAPLFQLFGSFPSINYGYLGVLNGKNFQITTTNIGGTNITPITNPAGSPSPTSPYWDAITMYQEFSTVSNWTPVVAIVFVSNTLPVTPNQVSTPLVYNDLAQVSFGGNNSATANIITDLVSNNGLYKSSLVYEPSAQYRMITLNGNRPLYNLDLQVFWRDRLGGLNPVRIPSGGSVTIKLSFLKRGGSAV
jgi:hypothetical protein